MRTLAVDKLNFVLILLSFVLACILPFELFLFGYAFLGPLHYLTEINWIKDKDYFVSNSNWKYIVLFCALLVATPYVFKLPFFQSFMNASVLKLLTVDLASVNNTFIFIPFFLSVVFLVRMSNKVISISIVIAILLVAIIYKNNAYNLFIGLFLPTIIHVYIFTLLFMIYGVKKQKKKVGVINILLMLLVPVVIYIIDVSWFNYQFSEATKVTYVDNNFHSLNAHLAKIIGVYDGLKFFFYEKVDLKIQIFIAFAYIYHYLNWFSKTTVIGWHKNLTKKTSLFLLIIWLFLVSFYLYDYKLGLAISIFMSFLHVMFEFPLNVLTIKSLLSKK